MPYLCSWKRETRDTISHHTIPTEAWGNVLNHFENLSPYDFESLCRDLLAAEYKNHLEMFTAGRDGGIDVRYIGNGTATQPDMIIQCKHYAGSGFSALKSRMIKDKQQALGLNAQRYILTTTVGMTPPQKTELKNALRPLINSESDILAKDDIESLLRDHPEVEKSHFRLWLNSTAVLEQILHAGVFAQTDIYLEQLEHTARTFVDNSGVSDVLNILDAGHVCIISGPAGVGKTTLANMLLLYHVGKGFQPIVVSENFNEAQQVYSKQNKQIFLYDDFLGRTTGVEKLGKNEDTRLSLFIDAISRAPSKRFLLTTRQHILEQATDHHEVLNSPRIRHSEYFFQMKAYSRKDRAHILYNHLYFSKLSHAHRLAIVESRRYSRMVASNNFTPRAVELAIALAIENRIDSAGIADFLANSLDDPSELWRNQLTKQLTHAQRVILSFLALEGGSTKKDTLEKFYLSSSGGLQEKHSFDSAMRGLEGSAVELRDVAGLDTVGFSNPGVEDAVLDHLLPMRNVVELLIGSTGYNRCLVLWNHANDESIQRNRRDYRPWSKSTLVPRTDNPARQGLQAVVDALISKYLEQIIPGISNSWDKGSVREEQLANLLLMSRTSNRSSNLTSLVRPLVAMQVAAWEAGKGAKSEAGPLLDVLLERDDILSATDRQLLVGAAVAFISDGTGDSPEDFYVMYELVEGFEDGKFSDFNLETPVLALETVQHLAEVAAISEWDEVPYRTSLYNIREEVDGWLNLLNDLGVAEPDEYATASEIISEAELKAEGYEEEWGRGPSLRETGDEDDIHRLFSSLVD